MKIYLSFVLFLKLFLFIYRYDEYISIRSIELTEYSYCITNVSNNCERLYNRLCYR